MNVKKQGLINIVLLLVILIALNVHKAVPSIKESTWFLPITLLTATGSYVTLMATLMAIIPKFEFLMKLYWGKQYLSGYWSYEYHKGGKLHIGIWHIEQDLDDIRVVGYGLNENYRQRTIVSSVSSLIEDRGNYFVINKRKELESNSDTNGHLVSVYSKTNLILDIPLQGFIPKPIMTIRATTEVFGGASSGDLHSDVMFKKHIKAKNSEDVVKTLKEMYGENSFKYTE